MIRAEYTALRQQEVQSDYNVEAGEHTLHGGQWDWFSFISAGQKQEQFRELCPATTRILEGIPSLMSDIPFAYAFFSALKPGAHIASHCAPMNLRLRCHFPLYAPEGAGMRVAEESRAWEEGKCTVFDDAYDHEVWHEGSEERVVLLFDVWHPELTTSEVGAIQTMFETAMKTPPGQRPG